MSRTIIPASRFIPVALAICLWFTQGTCRAQNVPEVRKLFVPADAPKQWPAGDWRPVKLAELEEFLKQPVQPVQAFDRAEYSATLAGDSLQAGRFEWTVRLPSAPPVLVLDPLSLPVSELAWTARSDEPSDSARSVASPAVWGLAPDGRQLLLCQRATGELFGAWSLLGRRSGESLLFDLGLPPAAASILTIKLPTSAVLHSSVGDVQHQTETSAGVRIWTVYLGGHTRTRLTVTRTAQTTPLSPTVLVRSVAEYRLRPDVVRFQVEFTPEVLDAPLREVQFDVDPNIDVLAVVADGTSLAWQSADSRGGISVRLPEPVLGAAPRLRVEGITRLSLGEMSLLPQIRMRQALLVGGSDDQSGASVILRIAAGLQLRDLRLLGLRQLAVAATADDEQLTFRQFGEQASLQLNVDQAELRLRALWHTHLQIKPEEWLATTLAEWSASSGTAYTLGCRISPEWEVTDVELQSSGPASSDPIGWQVRAEKEGQHRQLILQFTEPLSAPRSKRIKIVARRSAPSKIDRPLARFPARIDLAPLVPEQVHDGWLLVSILDANGPAQIDSESTFSAVAERDLARDWERFGTVTEQLAAGLTRSWFRSRLPRVAGSIQLNADRDALEIQADVLAEVSNEDVQEAIHLTGRSRSGPVDSLLVYVTEFGPDWTWSGSPALLDARRMPAAAQAAAGLPAAGELWTLQFKSPDDALDLTARRQRSATTAQRISLVAIPASQVFAGRLTVVTPSDSSIRFQPRRLERQTEKRPDAPVEGTSSMRVQRWKFSPLVSDLELTRPKGRQVLAPLVVRRSRLSARWSADGFDHYRATMDVRTDSVETTFALSLPASAELLDVQVNGLRVVPRLGAGGGEELLAFRVDLADDQTAHEVKLEYRVKVVAEAGPQRRFVAIARALHPVLAWQLEIEAPEGMVLTDPLGVSPLDGSTTDWAERFLGPLAQPHGGWFNPLSNADWLALLSWKKTTAEKRPHGSLAAGAAVPPASASVVVWDARRRGLGAWTTLGLCLAIGLAARRRIISNPPGVSRLEQVSRVAGWLTVAILGSLSILLPSGWAIFSGAALCALGLAFVCPLHWISRSASMTRVVFHTPRNSPVSQIVVATAVLITTCTLWGQDKRPAPSGVPETHFVVLIPVGADGKPAGNLPVAHVSPELETMIRRRNSPAERPDWLLTAARYSADMATDGGPLVRAEFDVAMFSSGKSGNPLTVTLPITNVNLGGEDAAFVDGRPLPVLPAERGLTIVIPAETAQTPPEVPVIRRLELRLHPRLDAAGGNSTRIGLPTVCHSTFAAIVPTGLTLHVTTSLQGEMLIDERTPPGTLWQLGSFGEVQLRWGTAAISPTEMEAAVSTLCDLSPGAVLLKSRVHSKVTRGQIDALSWVLPNNAVIRDVQIPELVAFRSVPEKFTKRLEIELARPLTGEFSATVTWIVPRVPEGTVRFAPLQLSTPGINTTITLQQFAVRQPADVRLDVTASEPDRLRPRTIEQFLATMPAEGIRPQQAWEYAGSAEWILNAVPLVPELSVNARQIGLIERDRVRAVWEAQVAPQTVPAFQYRFRLEPRLRLTSVSVSEGSVDCTAGWWRQGDALVLFLKEPGTKLQTIRLEGDLPLRLSQDETLPSIKLQDAVTSKTTTSLWSDPGLQVFITGPDETQRQQATLERGPEGFVPIGAFGCPVDVPLRWRVERVPAPNTASSLALLVPRETGWMFNADTMFKFAEGQSRRCELFIPKSLTEGLEVQTDPATQIDRQPVEGGTRLRFQPGDEVGALRVHWTAVLASEVSAQTAVARLADGRMWEFPRWLAGDAIHAMRLVVPRGVIAVDADGSPDVGSTSIALPAALRRDLAGIPEGDWELFSITDRPLRLRLPDLAAGILFSETTLWRQADELHGRSEFWALSGKLRTLDLTWPDGLNPIVLLVDDQVTPFPIPNGGLCQLPIPPGEGGHRLVLAWKARLSDRMSGALTQWPTPTAKELSASLALAVAVPDSADWWLRIPDERDPHATLAQAKLLRWESSLRWYDRLSAARAGSLDFARTLILENRIASTDPDLSPAERERAVLLDEQTRQRVKTLTLPAESAADPALPASASITPSAVPPALRAVSQSSARTGAAAVFIFLTALFWMNLRVRRAAHRFHQSPLAGGMLLAFVWWWLLSPSWFGPLLGAVLLLTAVVGRLIPPQPQNVASTRDAPAIAGDPGA